MTAKYLLLFVEGFGKVAMSRAYPHYVCSVMRL